MVELGLIKSGLLKILLASVSLTGWLWGMNSA